MADPFPPEKLIDLYRIAIDEFRFEVRLGWDRTTYFLVLNSGILTVATGLLKLENTAAEFFFVALIFLVGAGTSVIGARSILKGHEYYRRTVVKKTLIESRMGLTSPVPGVHDSLNLAITTTKGQGDHMAILSDPEAWIARKQRRSSITYGLCHILFALAVIDAVGAVISILMMIFHRAGGGNSSGFFHV